MIILSSLFTKCFLWNVYLNFFRIVSTLNTFALLEMFSMKCLSWFLSWNVHLREESTFTLLDFFVNCFCSLWNVHINFFVKVVSKMPLNKSWMQLPRSTMIRINFKSTTIKTMTARQSWTLQKEGINFPAKGLPSSRLDNNG